MDLASTDDYVSHSYAKKKKLPWQSVMEEMGGNENFNGTKIYDVPLSTLAGRKFVIPCYEISSVAASQDDSSYVRLCKSFGLNTSQAHRPKMIDLLLLHC